MVVVPSRLARELGVNKERVLRLVKWYALSKGKRPEDYLRPWPYPTSRPTYVMPDDFRDFVLSELASAPPVQKGRAPGPQRR